MVLLQLNPRVSDSEAHVFQFYCFQSAAELWDPEDGCIHERSIGALVKCQVLISARLLLSLPMSQLLFYFIIYVHVGG